MTSMSLTWEDCFLLISDVGSYLGHQLWGYLSNPVLLGMLCGVF